MPDQFTEITKRGLGSRLMGSVKGIFFGLLMFAVSFFVLYWNEGRIDMSRVAKKAVVVSSTVLASPEVDQKLVSTTGILMSDEKLEDAFLQTGNYLSLQRNVEMYVWQEEAQSETKKNLGGSETTETTYTYKKDWAGDSVDSTNFKYPEGHQNPIMSLDDNTVKVQSAKLGIYDIDMTQITLSQHKDLKLDTKNVILADKFALANDRYLFKGIGTLMAPEVGDVRVSYSVIQNPMNVATVFGKLDSENKTISPYYGTKNSKLYRMFEGTHDTAISKMQTEHKVFTWIFRAIGFALMWFGLMALFGPIATLLDVVPFFGSIGRAGISVVTFIVASILSALTIFISMIVHSIWGLIIVFLVVGGGIALYIKKKKK